MSVLQRLGVWTFDAPRVYVFPHAGGSPAEYRHLQDAEERLCWAGVQLAGRGARFGLASPTNISAIIDDVVPAIVDDVLAHGRPYSILGHSFGALVAFEAARALARLGCPQPNHLWLSAFAAPDRIPVLADLEELDDVEFLECLNSRFGSVPIEIRENLELSSIVSAYIRSDLKSLRSYVHPALDPSKVAMTACYGDQDVDFPPTSDWRRWCAAEYDTATFPGGHFYLRSADNSVGLARGVASTLRT